MRLQDKILSLVYSWRWPLLAAAALILLVPYCWATLYIHPFADDWTFAHKLHTMGRVDFVKHFYQNWSGRYFANSLLALPKSHPIYSLYMYRLLPLIFILFLHFSIFTLIKQLFQSVAKLQLVIVSLLATSVSINLFVEPFSALYWNCSSFYLPALAFYFLFIAFVLRHYFNQEKSMVTIVLVMVLTFLVSGLVETFIFANLIIMGCVFLYQKFYFKKTDWVAIGIITVTLFGLYLSVFNSGVGHRMDASKAEFTFIKAAVRAAYDLVIFNIIPLFYSPASILLLLCFPIIYTSTKDHTYLKKVLNINFFLVLFLGLFCFYIFHALSIYGAGYSLQGRVQNITQLLFYLFIVLLMIVYSTQYQLNTTLPKSSTFVITLFMLFTVFFNQNTRTTLVECLHALPQLDQEMQNRYTLIQKAKTLQQKEVVVPAITVNPRTFYLGTYKQEINYYNSNLCLREMSYCYGIKIQLNRKPDSFNNK